MRAELDLSSAILPIPSVSAERSDSTVSRHISLRWMLDCHRAGRAEKWKSLRKRLDDLPRIAFVHRAIMDAVSPVN